MNKFILVVGALSLGSLGWGEQLQTREELDSTISSSEAPPFQSRRPSQCSAPVWD